MKVLSVNPGSVFVKGETKGFHFNFLVNGQFVDSGMVFSSAQAAKQAMREKVRFERKKHGLLEVTP